MVCRQESVSTISKTFADLLDHMTNFEMSHVNKFPRSLSQQSMRKAQKECLFFYSDRKKRKHGL